MQHLNELFTPDRTPVFSAACLRLSCHFIERFGWQDMLRAACHRQSFAVYRWNQSLSVISVFCAMVICVAAGCSPVSTERQGQSALAADAESAEVWRFAIEESVGSVQFEYASEFKRRMEAATGGSVQVIVYPYGTLGTSTQITEQLNMGVLQFAMASPGSLGKFIPELQVFLLHFVLAVSERENQQLLSDPKLVAFFDALYEPKGLELLSIFSEGAMVWTLKKEVRQPEDFSGMKMRVMTSPILLAAYAAYGASPTPMPYSEVYSALQLNMIDGQVNPVFAIERQKFHEVTNWMVFPGHASFVTTCAANRDFLASLHPKRRNLVRNVIRELDEFIFDVQTDFQNERLKRILDDKKKKRSDLNLVGDIDDFMASLTPAEKLALIDENAYLHLHRGLSSAQRQAFRSRSQPVRDVFLEIGGQRAGEALDMVLRR
jgi:TRAP-type C4-dicarboxylate transport system substrate-binding protein